MQEDISELFRVMDRMRKAWQNVTPCDTLSKSQFGTLAAIARPWAMGGPPGSGPLPEAAPDAVRLTDLARAMRQSLPALSQRVSALEAMGYVERVPDPTDRRVTGVRVTPEGMAVQISARERFNGMMTRAIESLGQENLHTLLRLLTQLAQELEASAADPNGTKSKRGKTENTTGSENDT